MTGTMIRRSAVLVGAALAVVALLAGFLLLMTLASDPSMRWLLFGVTFLALWVSLTWVGILVALRFSTIPGLRGWKVTGPDPATAGAWAATALPGRPKRAA